MPKSIEQTVKRKQLQQQQNQCAHSVFTFNITGKTYSILPAIVGIVVVELTISVLLSFVLTVLVHCLLLHFTNRLHGIANKSSVCKR